MKDKPPTQYSAADLEIIEALVELRDALRAKQPIERKFTVNQDKAGARSATERAPAIVPDDESRPA